jgi:pre-mRNA-splicing helicase BRR2
VLQVVKTAVRLLHAMVDVLSSKNALNVCLLTMELSQMVTQALHSKDSHLMQLPAVSRALAEKCEAAGIEDLAALQEMDDADRRRLLSMTEQQYAAVAAFCNRYPDDVQLEFSVTNGKDVSPENDEDARAFEFEGGTDEVRLCSC